MKLIDARKKCWNKDRVAGATICGVFAVWAFSQSIAQACGPFNKIAMFTHTLHPDFPFSRFSQGQLGVIQPTYARSYLAVAYRVLSGRKLDPAMQKECNALWRRRLEGDADMQAAVSNWLNVRKSVKGAPLPAQVDSYTWSSYGPYLKYTTGAFKTATQTLKDKVAKYGVDDQRVKDWVIAQDLVFGVASTTIAGGTANERLSDLKELPASADAGDRADRAYQIACRKFYQEDFDGAAEQFRAISKDAKSRRQKMGLYLCARSFCRGGTLLGNPEKLKEAQSVVDEILQSKDLAELKPEALRLQAFIKYRTEPNERLKEVVAILLGSDTKESFTEALGDYTRLLDHCLEAKSDQGQTQPTGRLEPGDQAPTRRLQTGDWAPTRKLESGDQAPLISSTQPGIQALAGKLQSEVQAHPTSRAELGVQSPANKWQTDDQDVNIAALLIVLFGLALSVLRAGTAGNTRSGRHLLPGCAFLLAVSIFVWSCSTKTSKTPASETKNATASDGKEKLKMPDDELSTWIVNFQSNEPAAAGKAYGEWKKSSSVPWLVSTVAKLKVADPHKDEVLAAVAKIPVDSPAFHTCAYHRVRLLKESGKNSEALSAMKAVLSAAPDRLPPSERNLFISQEIPLCDTLDEFAKIAAPRPAAIVWDYDINEMPVDQAQSNGEEPQSHVELDKAEKSNQYLATPQCLTGESADSINTAAPLSIIEKLAIKQELPKKVRLDLAQAGWVRALLLKNDKSLMTLLPVLTDLRPELKTALADYAKAGSPAEKEFVGVSIVLANPAMRPYVTSGLGRETEFTKIDNYRDNWWGPEAPQLPQPYSENGPPPRPKRSLAFLTTDEQKAGAKEYADLKTLGTAPNHLAKMIVAWSHGHPKDARLPEVLHNAVRATRYGSTDEKTTTYSKEAYQALHKNFPTNQWAKKTPYWFGNN